MQGERIPIPMYRNERDHMGLTGRAVGGASALLPPLPVNPARQPGGLPLGTPRSSMQAATRKLVSYARAGGSQGKLWWTPATVLTCKSIDKHGHRGESPIELASSWFPPKCPPG